MALELFMEFVITQKVCIKDKAKPGLLSGAVYCHSCSDPQLQWLLVKAERLADVTRDTYYSQFSIYLLQVMELTPIPHGTQDKYPYSTCMLLHIALNCPGHICVAFNPHEHIHAYTCRPASTI